MCKDVCAQLIYFLQNLLFFFKVIFLIKFTLDDSVEMTSVRNGTFKGCFILVKLKTYMVFFGICGSIIFFNYKKSLIRN